MSNLSFMILGRKHATHSSPQLWSNELGRSMNRHLFNSPDRTILENFSHKLETQS